MTHRGVDHVGRVPDRVTEERDDPVDSDGSDTRFRLALGDIVPGAEGEVVLFNDSALREVVIVAPTQPTVDGVIDEHVTAEGVDVAGFRFLRFRRDLILFHDPDTHVTIEVG